MSALTQNERDGLEDVFLSIHTPGEKYKKLKEISSLVLSQHTSFNLRKLLKVAKYGLNETKISQILVKLSKKKKNLSK